jgi:hypothetical protein
MARPTANEIAAAARAEEREACIEFIRDKMVEIDALAKRSRVSASEASVLKRRLDAIADGLAAGLHR